MPANKNAMTRYKIQDELLSSRYHNYSLDDLTEEVSGRLSEMYPETNGVVRRTIEKDIYYLEYEGPFMVDIERYTISGYNKEKQKSYVKQCLRYSNPSYSIFKKRLTDDEEYLLSEALSLLGQFDGLPNLDALEGLRLGFGVKRNDRKIISFTKNPLENSNILGELFTSISQRQVIELHYIKFGDQNNELVLNVYPYLLKEYNRRWFLFAATENNGKLLCFGLDRIKSIIPLPSHKYIEYHEDVNNIFKDIIGVTINLNSPIYNIIIWVSNFSKDYIETKPIHESQNRIDHEQENKLRKQYPVLREGQFYQINCRCNYELIRELASYGKDLLVIEPTEIQEKVRDRIQSLNEAYLQLDTI